LSREKPNILLITTDQQRFDTVSADRPDFLRVPHLTQLAADGVTFTRAYADCPICVPGRAAIMTGQSAFRHGMGTNDRTCAYFDEKNTLPTLLRQAGYQTFLVGKAHFYPQRKKHGFDETITLDDYYREMSHNGSPLQPRRHGLGENELVSGMSTVPESCTLTSWITEKSVDFLSRRKDPTKPWFLWTSYSKPHPPLDPCEPYYSMYRQCAIPKPLCGTWARAKDRPQHVFNNQYRWGTINSSAAIVQEAKAAYYGLVTQIDYNIGRLIGAVQDTGCFFSPNDNTLIIFCSDHGELMGDHAMGAKSMFHEGSAHIPLIVREPRTWKNRRFGVSSSALACLQDVTRTILEIAGAAVPSEVDGINLIAKSGEITREHLVCGQGFSKEHPGNVNWVGITDGTWKYTWYYDDGAEELFNRESDPHELINVAPDPKSRSIKDALKSALRVQLARSFVACETFLRDKKLYNRETERPDAKTLAAYTFPGFMRDEHGADVLH